MKHIVFVESNANGLSALTTAKELGYYVTFIRSTHFEHYYIHDNMFAKAMASVDAYIELNDITDELALGATLSSVHASRPVDALITVLEHIILPLARAARRVGIPFTSAEAVELARDKGAMRRRLDEMGVPSVRFVTGADPNHLIEQADKIGYPLIFKPTSGLSSWFIKRVDSRGDLEVAFDEYRRELGEMNEIYNTIMNDTVVIEEYLEGTMISLEICASRGVTTPLSICERKRYSKNEILELGSTMPATLPPDQWEAVCQYGQSVLEAMGLDMGIFHLEIILTTRGPLLIEANPRLIGGMGPRLLSLTLGRNIYGLLIDAHLGNPVLPPDSAPRCYATSRVMALEEESIYYREELSPWHEEYHSSLVYYRFGLKQGDKVPKAASNEHSFGYFVVQANSPWESEHLAEAILGRLREELQLPLIIH
ncbi:MAG: ATP-grasp domain-containing protein [Desulfopila sp.]